MPPHETPVVPFPSHSVETRRPASRASWSGQLTLADFQVPVKAYAATVSSQTSPLCQIHAGCGCRIQQRKCCPLHGELTAEQLAKGYTYLPDQILELTESELQALKAADDKTVRLTRFLDPADFDLNLFSGRSFYLLPAHPAAGAAYVTMARALHKQRRWGLGTMVLSGRQQLLIGRAHGCRLMLHLLHWPAQTRACPQGDDTPTEPARSALRALQKTISDSQTPILWEKLTDDWETRLTAVVQKKVAQRATRTSPASGRNGRSPARRPRS